MNTHIASDGRLLAGVTRELAVKWAETKEHWQDAKAQEFEHKFLSELFASVDRSLPVFEDLEKLIKKIRTDCE
jgi:hypothetical protein